MRVATAPRGRSRPGSARHRNPWGRRGGSAKNSREGSRPPGGRAGAGPRDGQPENSEHAHADAELHAVVLQVAGGVHVHELVAPVDLRLDGSEAPEEADPHAREVLRVGGLVLAVGRTAVVGEGRELEEPRAALEGEERHANLERGHHALVAHELILPVAAHGEMPADREALEARQHVARELAVHACDRLHTPGLEATHPLELREPGHEVAVRLAEAPDPECARRDVLVRGSEDRKADREHRSRRDHLVQVAAHELLREAQDGDGGLPVVARARSREREGVAAAQDVLEAAEPGPGAPPLAREAEEHARVERAVDGVLDAEAHRAVARLDVEVGEGVLDDLGVAPLAADPQQRAPRRDRELVGAARVDEPVRDAHPAPDGVAEAEDVLVPGVELTLVAAEGGVRVVVGLELEAPRARLLHAHLEHRVTRRLAGAQARMDALDARVLLQDLERLLELRHVEGRRRAEGDAPLEHAWAKVARALDLDRGDASLDDADPDHAVARILVGDHRARVHVAALDVEPGDRVADRAEVLGVDLAADPGREDRAEILFREDRAALDVEGAHPDAGPAGDARPGRRKLGELDLRALRPRLLEAGHRGALLRGALEGLRAGRPGGHRRGGREKPGPQPQPARQGPPGHQPAPAETSLRGPSTSKARTGIALPLSANSPRSTSS